MSSILQVDSQEKGIWRFQAYYPPVERKFRLSLDEGGTREIEKDGIIFKREDQNPTGSLKDRGMAYQISICFERGLWEVALSTSGNAGIAAAAYCRLAGIKAHIFVSHKVNRLKLAEIQNLGAIIRESARPLSSSLRFAKDRGIFDLRPSKDKFGPEGYKSIAFEIFANWGEIESLFLPVSSGTALVGIARGFQLLGFLPKIFLVQTEANCPLASVFDNDYQPKQNSLCDALVAKVIPRRGEILDFVENSGGSGFVVSDEKIQEAAVWLKKQTLETSFEGAAALAGIFEARKKGINLGKKIVCLLTGKPYAK